MKKWEQFERLAEQIYAELSPQATVRWNEKLRGHDSETDRQIDVTIRWSVDNHEYLHIVQARDRSTPADVNSVGEFASVVMDVRAAGGSLVCRSGFTGAAKTMARNKGLMLHNLHDSSTSDWKHAVSIAILWENLVPELHSQGSVWVDAGEVFTKTDEITVLSPDDGLTIVRPVSTFLEKWNNGELPMTVGPSHGLYDPRPLKARIESPSGQEIWREFMDFALVYTVRRDAWLGWFTPEESRGLIDHVNGGIFLASHLPLDQIPSELDPLWEKIDNPGELAISIPGTVVTTLGFQISPPSNITVALTHSETGEVLHPEP
jgi:hypothetical protein